MAKEYTLTETITETRRYTVIMAEDATEEAIRVQAYGHGNYDVTASEVTEVSITPLPLVSPGEISEEEWFEYNLGHDEDPTVQD